MNNGQIRLQRNKAVGRLVLDNPTRHNALSLSMWQDLARAVADLEADPGIRVMVILGAGERAFAAGADISRFEEERAAPEAIARYDAATAAAFTALAETRKPTLAEIRGYCIGGGMALAVCCDLRFCSSDARFAIPAARLGIGYDPRGVERVQQLVGPAYTREIFYTARQFNAEEALGMGLVNRVVAPAALAEIVAETVTTIAANAPLTVAAVKETVHELGKEPDSRDWARLQRLAQRCADSEDYVEGRRAFVEKRPPRFKGH